MNNSTSYQFFHHDLSFLIKLHNNVTCNPFTGWLADGAEGGAPVSAGVQPAGAAGGGAAGGHLQEYPGEVGGGATSVLLSV